MDRGVAAETGDVGERRLHLLEFAGRRAVRFGSTGEKTGRVFRHRQSGLYSQRGSGCTDIPALYRESPTSTHKHWRPCKSQ